MSIEIEDDEDEDYGHDAPRRGRIPYRDAERALEKLHSLWNGEVPLFQAFWIYFFGGVFALGLTGALTGAEDLFDFLALLWSCFMIRPVMLAADHHEGKDSFGLLAKIAVVLLTLGFLGDLFS